MAQKDEPHPSDGSYAQWMRRTAAAVKAKGLPVISLFDSSVPEPLDLLQSVVQEAFDGELTSRYASAFTNGNPYVIDHLAGEYAVPRDQILCTTGASAAVSMLYRTLAEVGDHVLIETPGFDLFTDLALDRGLQVSTFARTGNRYRLSMERLGAQLRPETRLIVLSNLHNPSGMAFDPADFDALAQVAEARGLWVIVDEVYLDFAKGSGAATPAVRRSSRFVSISSLTKIFGLHTVRCGWIVACPEVMDKVRMLSERLEFGVSNLAHAVAALALEKSAAFTAYASSMLSSARPVMTRTFEAWRAEGLIEGQMPDYGCICFPKLPAIPDTLAFTNWLAVNTGLIVAPGEHFGLAGHVRIGFGQEVEKLTSSLAILEQGARAYAASTALKSARR